MNDTDNEKKAGTAEFKTVKAGCGIRFDPETLDEDAGFDFSAAEQLNDAASAEQADQPKKPLPDTGHSPHDMSEK
jgi:hypothetical protein